MARLAVVEVRREPMASNLDSEHRLRPLIGLLTSVLLLGTLLAWWGTRDHRQLFGESLRQPVTAAGVAVPQVTSETSALLDRGFQISERQCAGCHELATRSTAPSYREIVAFYRSGSAGAGLRSRLASAVTHPWPGWGNFSPGPAEPGLSLEDRTAVASWMLNSFDGKKNAGEGAGQ
jgi:cytochrome c551/c552